MTTDRPYVLMPATPGGRRHRWYPDDWLKFVSTRMPGAVPAHLDPEMLDPGQCADLLPTLREGLEDLARIVTMVEARAGGQNAAFCAVCRSRFYPSRSDASYCSGRCRMRAHRRGAAPPTPADTRQALPPQMTSYKHEGGRR